MKISNFGERIRVCQHAVRQTSTKQTERFDYAVRFWHL